MHKGADGFTLVELMVVVLVIGILVAVAVPVFNAAKASAEQKTCFANQRMMEGVYQQYASANGWTQTDIVYSSFYVSQGYLKKIPQCPSWARDSDHYYSPTRWFGGPSHQYYFYYGPPGSGYVPGEVWMFRPDQNNPPSNTATKGCPTPAGSTRHGYYRTPGVNFGWEP